MFKESKCQHLHFTCDETVKWPHRDRKMCWSLIVKPREESRSPEKCFKKPCCTKGPFPVRLQHKCFLTGAVSNSATFLSGVCIYDWSDILLLFFPLRKLWVFPLSRKTLHQICKRFHSPSTPCTSCWDADSLVSMSFFSSPHAEVAKPLL